MKKEENEYLNLMHSNGKGDQNAYGEIAEFNDSQKQFKLLNRESRKKETLIRHLKEEIEKLKIRVAKLKKTPIIKKNSKLGQDVFLEDMKKEQSKKEKRWKKYLNRIGTNIEPNRDYTKKDFQVEFMVPQYVLDWAIEKLIESKVIDSKITSRGVRFIKHE